MNRLRSLLLACLCLLCLGCGRLGFQEPLPGTVGDAPDGSVAVIPQSCFDGMQNQDEEAMDCGGSCPPCAAGASSCAELKTLNPSAGSGVYQIDPDNGGPEAAGFAYCEMVGDGGGWTLAAKIDGNATSNFNYDSLYWTTTATLNETSADLDNTEAKLNTFNTVPFTELRLGMSYNNQLRWTVMAHTATSLRSVFAANTFVPLTGQREQWLFLINGSYLQPNCNRQGFNTQSGSNATGAFAVRLGIIANGETDCTNPDSFVGYGYSLRGNSCTPPITTLTGNGATCVGGGSVRDIKAFGYIMVR